MVTQNTQLWQAPSWTVSYLRAVELPEKCKSQVTISSLEQARPSLWRQCCWVLY